MAKKRAAKKAVRKRTKKEFKLLEQQHSKKDEVDSEIKTLSTNPEYVVHDTVVRRVDMEELGEGKITEIANPTRIGIKWQDSDKLSWYDVYMFKYLEIIKTKKKED